MIRPFIVVVAVSLTSLAAGSGAQSAQGMAKRGGNPEAAKKQNPVPSTPESIGQGRRVYQRLCSRCHGSAGERGGGGGGGGPPPPPPPHPGGQRAGGRRGISAGPRA